MSQAVTPPSSSDVLAALLQCVDAALSEGETAIASELQTLTALCPQSAHLFKGPDHAAAHDGTAHNGP